MREDRMVGAKLPFWLIPVGLISILPAAPAGSASVAGESTLTPASMARIGTVDERYQSYNIEMVEVTGGEFWKPYGPERGVEAARPPNSNLFQYRRPIDLSNARLRKLASALAPAYLRVSGTWANTTYFADSDNVPSTPPRGFKAILTRQRWRG